MAATPLRQADLEQQIAAVESERRSLQSERQAYKRAILAMSIPIGGLLLLAKLGVQELRNSWRKRR